MVYCGKPSRGCQVCKTRRIKCDEARPTCSQCAKSRKQCPGYKDEFDLVFRNETKATERRARKGNSKPVNTQAALDFNPSTTHSRSSTDSSSDESSPVDNIIISPTQIVSDQAACHFISNFILVPPQGTERGYLEFVVPIYNNNPLPHFKLAFEACSLASLGNRVGTGRDIEKQALTRYTAALTFMYKAIRDPSMSQQDATVAAILLLGLFENISARNLGMFAWGSHTEGAVRLVEERGPDQFQTKLGRDLFVAVRTQMMIHTFSTGKGPTVDTRFWIKGAAKDRAASICQLITLKVGEVKKEVNGLMITLQRDPINIDTILKVIKKCQARDQELVHWSKNLPSHFRCRPVTWIDDISDEEYNKSEVYPGRVDAFKDIWVASVWNTMRCSRLVLISIILRCSAWTCAPLDYRATPEYTIYSRISRDIITDLVSSIPYQLGWFSKRKHMLKNADLTTYACGKDDAPKGLSGYFVTWPLSCIMTQDYTTQNQRLWARGRLTFVSDCLGVRYARMLTEIKLRVPSMLIHRDNKLTAGLDTAQSDFQKILSTRTVPPSSISADPMQYREFVMKMELEIRLKKTKEITSKKSGDIEKDTA